MGNCQASEAVAVVIQHPSNKVERIYCSVNAHDVMNSNPGHYVALVVASPTAKSGDGVPVKQVKLLRPNDTLLIGQVYRLISFEDVLKEFTAKKSVKVGKLLESGGDLRPEKKKKFAGTPGLNQNPPPDSCPSVQMEQLGISSGSSSRASLEGTMLVGAVEASLTDHNRSWKLKELNSSSLPSHLSQSSLSLNSLSRE